MGLLMSNGNEHFFDFSCEKLTAVKGIEKTLPKVHL